MENEDNGRCDFAYRVAPEYAAAITMPAIFLQLLPE